MLPNVDDGDGDGFDDDGDVCGDDYRGCCCGDSDEADSCDVPYPSLFTMQWQPRRLGFLRSETNDPCVRNRTGGWWTADPETKQHHRSTGRSLG